MTPQETVERALALSKADGCVVVTTERSEANLRWASNTLTTNGSMRSRKVAVISVVNGATGTAAGWSSSAVTADRLEDLVGPANGPPATPARPTTPPTLVEPTDSADRWEAAPEETSIDVFGQVAPALGDAFGRATGERRLLFGFAERSGKDPAMSISPASAAASCSPPGAST